jgi:cyclopropane-fatty-acyl-phospholipid synthase
MPAYIWKSAEKQMTDLLATADIKVNGDRPWDIRIKNKGVFDRVASSGSLGLGEAYMDGWWECEALDHFFFNLLRHGIEQKFRTSLPVIANAIKAMIINRQSRRKAFEVGEKHYDAGNDLFEKMLDPHMAYSCGYWQEAENLQQAQEAKLEMICQKLLLAPGMKLLDIGCGWGSLVRYAARHYGVSAVGVTVSKEQAALARERCAGLPVEIRLQDYRKTEGSFDAVVSVGMFEHVGYKNHRTFMKVVRRCLKDEGLFLLHTIASNNTVRNCDPWFEKYIFPNSMLPSIKQIGAAMEQYFIMEDWHNIGVNYDRTLLAWHENFERNWHTLKDRYDERFHRMWRYYLLSIAGCFRSRFLQVWQVVMSPHGKLGGYTRLRSPACVSN